MALGNYKIFETGTFIQPIHHKLIITLQQNNQDEFSWL